MKKHILFNTLLFAAATMFAKDIQTLKAELNSNDVNLAQNARLAIQNENGSEDILIASLKAEKDATVKEGIIYSLGKLKSVKAYPMIVTAAKSGNSKAAVLALINYQNADSLAVLKSLASSYKTDLAKRAYSMALKLQDYSRVPSVSEYNKADANGKVELLESLPALNKDAKKFLDSIKATDERSAISMAVAYSYQDCEDSARKIVELDKQYKNIVQIVDALGTTQNSEKVLVEEIQKGNLTAVKAAAILRAGECEDAMLALALKDGSIVSKIAIESLKQVGTIKSFNGLVNSLESGEASMLGTKVATLVAIYAGLSDDDRKAAEASAEKVKSSATGKTKSAIAKVLSTKAPDYAPVVVKKQQKKKK